MALAKNLLLSLVSVLVFLFLAEAVLWIFAPPATPSLPKGLMTRTPAGWTLTPGFEGVMDNRRDFSNRPVHADARGLRITPAAAGIERPERRIHLLGDSQTFGHGLADGETWANRLQELLIRRGHGRVKVENYGVPAINIDQYRVRLKSIVATAAPGDVVLVGVSWNDLTTPQSRNLIMKVVGGYLVRTPAGAKPGADPSPPQRDIPWRIWLYERTGVVIPRATALKPFLEGLAKVSALGSFLLPHIRGIYFRLRDNPDPFAEMIRDRVPESNFLLLDDMKRSAEAKRLRFAVLLLPSRFFVEDEVYRIYSQGGRAFPARNYQGHIARPLCERFGIACLDPFEVLKRHNAEGVVFPFDGHYNPRGAKLIGAFVADALAPMISASKGR